MLGMFEDRGEGALAQQVLVLVYAVIAVAGMVLPLFAHRFGGVRSTMVCAAATYVVFILAVACSKRDTMLGAAALLGIGGTMLWATMSRIVVAYGNSAWQGRSFAAINVATSIAIAIGNKGFHELWTGIGNATLFICAAAAGCGIGFFLLLPTERLEDAVGKREVKQSCGVHGWGVAFALLALHCCNATWGGSINGGLMLFGQKKYGEAWINLISLTPLVNCAAALGGGWLTDRIGGVRALAWSYATFFIGVVLIARFHESVLGYGTGACIVAAAHGAIYAAVTGSIKKFLNARWQKIVCYGLSTSGALAIVVALLVSRMPVEITFGLLIGAGAVGCVVVGAMAWVVKSD